MNDSIEMNGKADKSAMTKLKQIETDLLKRLKQLSMDKSKSHSKDSEDQAVERENDEVVDQLESEASQELQQVQNSIQRISQGKYHECTKCGFEIPAERLEAIPYTTFCISCAETMT